MYDAEENPWFTKDRSESISKRIDRAFNDIDVSNPALGLNIYKNAINKEDISWIIDTLENNLSNGSEHSWKEAQVTNSNKPVKAARDCSDFKFSNKTLGSRNDFNKNLFDITLNMFSIILLPFF